MFSDLNLKIVRSYVIYDNIDYGSDLSKTNNGCEYVLDIGGTLIKLVYTINPRKQMMLREEKSFFEEHNYNANVTASSFNNPLFYPLILFCLIPINNVSLKEQIDNIFSFLIKRGIYKINDTVSMTGGGSIRFKNLIEDKYKICISHSEEMFGIVMGYFKLYENESKRLIVKRNDLYLNGRVNVSNLFLFPTLIVSVGSGISIIKVENKNKFERINGTRFGGGTVLGLGKLLGINNYQELIGIYNNLSNDNNNIEVDKENCYFKDILFSSLKNNNCSKHSLKFKEKAVHDIINMMYDDLAYLLCLMLLKHNIRNVVFCGNNVSNHHDIIVKSLDKYSSLLIKDNISIFFHKLDGFFGAIGACFSLNKI